MLRASVLAVVLTVLITANTGRADIVIDTVIVGDAGNVEDTRFQTPGWGGVAHVYHITTFEVTAGLYVKFLDAIAADDTYGLYNPDMWEDLYGCQIERGGSPGSYTYSVAGDWADRPVNYVSWGDVARFSNWLHHGQPTGPQDSTTTEDGSYFLDGAMTNAELLAIVREPDATWVIPSQDEWYKAAYYNGFSDYYYNYPMSSFEWPDNDLFDPDPGNSANFETPWSGGPTVGSPYWRTEVGDFENSLSPYGTFDQGGNVWEWNEAIFSGTGRGVRGGSYDFSHGLVLHASYPNFMDPANEFANVGFRVAMLPDPGDSDGDGDVDLTDYAGFADCMTGPSAGPYTPICGVFDLDFDGDVDLQDFALLEAAFAQ